MLTIDEAWKTLLPHLAPLESTSVALDRCCGRVLSADLDATLDVPPTDVSAMDGFALSKNTISIDGSDLEALIGPTIAAGDPPGIAIAALQAGSTVVPRIMTGAPVPHDCEQVVPVELATVSEDGKHVRITAADQGTSGQHIRRRGEVSRAKETLVAAGQTISAATTSLLATHGYTRVPLWRNPSVAYATTGSEIVPPSKVPGPGQIRDSHSAFFHSALTQLGIKGTSLGIVVDDAAALRAVVETGLDKDVLLMSGGVSMGEFDLVEDVLSDLGCQVLFDGVSIQPGKPVVAATHKHGVVFGLPGNPASAQITFRLFVEPALRCLRGESAAPWSDALTAILAAPLPAARGRDRFVPCFIRREQDNAGLTRLVATPRPPQGSHDVVAFGITNGLVRINRTQGAKAAGDSCSVVFVT